MNDNIVAMAEKFYGFGRWSAQYWFLGPEPGQGKHEKNNLSARAEAWRLLNDDGLCDCRGYHKQINELRWHFQQPRVQLQNTWRPMILLLMSYLGKLEHLAETEKRELLRRYQRDEWGVSTGQTCVIELSGLAANSLGIVRNRTQFLHDRIAEIRKRLLTEKPRLVVMFGKGQQKEFERIAGCKFTGDPISGFTAGMAQVGQSILGFTPHPNHGPGNEYWIQFGERLRLLAGR